MGGLFVCNLPVMDLRQLRHLAAVVEHRNLSRAAAAVNISTPALSKSLAKLEAEVGARLVERGPRGVTPTVFGLALARHARVMAAENQHALHEIEALRGAKRGRLAIGGTTSAGSQLLVRAVASLVRERPGLEVAVIGGKHRELMALLQQGDLDLMLTGFGGAPAPETLEIPLASSRYAVVAGRAHALAGRSAVPLADAAAFPWIVPDNIGEAIPQWHATFSDAGATPPVPAITSDSYLFILATVADGDFLGVVPEDLVASARNRDVVAIDLEGAAWPRRVRAVVRARGTRPPATEALIAELKRLAAD